MWFVLACAWQRRSNFQQILRINFTLPRNLVCVWSDSHSLILPLSSDTLHKGLHWVQIQCYAFVLTHWRTILNINITFMYGGIPHLCTYQSHQRKFSFHLVPTMIDLIWKLRVLFWKKLECHMFVQSSTKKLCRQMMSQPITLRHVKDWDPRDNDIHSILPTHQIAFS